MYTSTLYIEYPFNFMQYIWQRRLDISDFIRKFKKGTGYTPVQYRKPFSKLELT
ncbi:hypothetical protein [Paenibacillus chungangensis]|uniref:HTH araC/xylS-type domain-containing protein n=1 Tax=Paenibacillus chungangensis TaxID=696535 RepID=A0ABW3HTT4_9BACL